MNNIKFYSVFSGTCIALIALSFMLFILLDHHPQYVSLFLMQGLSSLACYILLGIGLGVPLILFATILGWLQLILLLSGEIDPHLKTEGFLNVLKTLFSKI